MLRRAGPFALFAAITLSVFWRFLLFGDTLYATEVLRPVEEKPAWWHPGPSHVRVIDNVLLLRSHLRIYNEGLQAGELRLWNPHLLCGVPIYADPMVHPFYPPNLVLHRLLPPDAAYEWFLLLHLFFSGAAMYWALRAQGRSALAATFGGAAWMLLGYHGVWFSTAVLAGVSVFGPLALMWLLRALERASVPDAALAAAAMGLAILGSHPQHALHLFLMLAAWAAVRARKPAARPALVFVVGSVGAGLAAILTRLETIAEGYRNPAEAFRQIYEAPGPVLLSLGTTVAGKACFGEPALVGYEFYAFFGVALAAAAALGLRKADAWARFVGIAGGVALLFAFVPPLAGLLRHVPLLNASTPSRWIFCAGLCAVILGARGLDAWIERPDWLRWGACGTAGLLLAACAVVPSRPMFETALGAAVVAAAAWFRRREAALAALLFELLPVFWFFNPHRESEPLRETPEPVRNLQPGFRGTGALFRRMSTHEMLAASDLFVGNNVLAHAGLESPAGFEAIVSDRMVRYANLAGGFVRPEGRGLIYAEFDSPLLDTAGVRYLFLPFAMEPPRRWRRIGEWGELRLYENPAAMPRAWLATGWKGAPDVDTASGLVATADVIEGAGDSPPAGRAAGVVWQERSPDRHRLTVEAPAKSWLIVADAYDSGWVAEVDGQPAEIRPANVAFRAVELAPGPHTVTFRFRPDSVRKGLAGSAAFLVLLLALGLIRRHPAPPAGVS